MSGPRSSFLSGRLVLPCGIASPPPEGRPLLTSSLLPLEVRRGHYITRCLYLCRLHDRPRAGETHRDADSIFRPGRQVPGGDKGNTGDIDTPQRFLYIVVSSIDRAHTRPAGLDFYILKGAAKGNMAASSPRADDVVLLAAKGLAMTGFDLAASEESRKAARKEFEEKAPANKC